MSVEDLIDKRAIQAKLEIREMRNEALREAFTALGCTPEQATHLIRSTAQKRRHEERRNGR